MLTPPQCGMRSSHRRQRATWAQRLSGLRRVDVSGGGDVGGTVPAKVIVRQRVEVTDGGLIRVDLRSAWRDELQWRDAAPDELPRRIEGDVQHRADRGIGIQAERVVAAEVAEAVGDQVAVVPLEAA